MFTVKIDDSQLQKFLKESPRRANWALSEALKAAGYSIKKKVTAHIKSATGWPPLAESTIERKTKYNVRSHKYRTSPLGVFARLLRVSYSKGKGKPFVKVGYFNTNNWFKKFFGVGAAEIAELNETGNYTPRKSNKASDRWAKEQGMSVKTNRGGKYGVRPGRPIITPIWNKVKNALPAYISNKFFDVFFSKKKAGLKY
jgi:hypothetical protein